ncbi:MAG: Uncharacterised protein [Synechococcus sp. MIT S9220]|nr:MAG: Uncharacterised protein [Synechococcus sp. MIT S9220]
MEVVKSFSPEPHSVASASLIGAHDVEPDKSVGMVVADACDASDRIVTQATRPDALAVGLAINPNIS